jgi:hypothetical protein
MLFKTLAVDYRKGLMHLSPKNKSKKIEIIETKLGRNNSLGFWEKINENKTIISIDERLKGFQKLMIIIHECLHETCGDWTEEKVQQVSEFLAGVLWKYDYRNVDNEGAGTPDYTAPKITKRKIVVRPYADKKTKKRIVSYASPNAKVDEKCK